VFHLGRRASACYTRFKAVRAKSTKAKKHRIRLVGTQGGEALSQDRRDGRVNNDGPVSETPRASSVAPQKRRRPTSVLRRLDQRPLSWRSPSSAPLALCARLAEEGVLCGGFVMVSRIVPSSPKGGLRKLFSAPVTGASSVLHPARDSPPPPLAARLRLRCSIRLVVRGALWPKLAHRLDRPPHACPVLVGTLRRKAVSLERYCLGNRTPNTV
jgi:hypothetical protein